MIVNFVAQIYLAQMDSAFDFILPDSPCFPNKIIMIYLPAYA